MNKKLFLLPALLLSLVAYGQIAITPPAGGDDLGDHTATQDINLATFDLTSTNGLKASDSQAVNFWGADVVGFFGNSAIIALDQQVVFFASTDTAVAATSTASLVVTSGAQTNASSTAKTGDVDSKTGDVTAGSANTGGYAARSGGNSGSGNSGPATFESGTTNNGNSGNVQLSSGSSTNGNSGNVTITVGSASNGVRGNLTHSGHVMSFDTPVKTPTGTTLTINWVADLNNVDIDLNSATGDVTLTLNGAPASSRAIYYIKVIQGATTRNLIWPAIVDWPGGTAPTISAANDDVDLIKLYFDGFRYLGTFDQNFD